MKKVGRMGRKMKEHVVMRRNRMDWGGMRRNGEECEGIEGMGGNREERKRM